MNRTIINDHGLFVDQSTEPPTCVGYIINFGPYTGDPSGGILIDGRKPTNEEIKTHNDLLVQMEWEAMLKHGRGILYYQPKEIVDRRELGPFTASQFGGQNETYIGFPSRSRTNMGCERLDFNFRLDGNIWCGRAQGDNQILRVKRTKTKA